jgi:3-phenylpropionate/cinnamic acid dioxygenase small subunit
MAAKKKTAKRRTAPVRAKRAPAKRAAAPVRARAGNGADPLAEVQALLYRQADLLDRRQWEAFIELFAEDGVYWMPASPEQTTGEGVPSIFYEDRNLMRVRMKRVTHPHAWSQAPDWGTNHVVSNVMVEPGRNGELVVRSRFHMMEFRRDATRHFAGSYIHHLKRTPRGWRIRMQRVDMVNAQGPYDYVLQVWV